MKPFRFRLATLLKLREQARDACRGQLAEAFEAESQLRAHRADTQQQLDSLIDQLTATRKPGRVDVDSLVTVQRYQLVLQAEYQTQTQQLELIAEEIERRRLALVAADREVQVLEKLQEQGRERHDLEAKRSETKQLDEVALQIHKMKV